MDAGTAGVVGAVVGAIVGAGGTIIGNVVQQWLPNRRANNLAKKRRVRLRQVLEDPQYEWRNLTTLMSSIGADVQTTTELLIEIDARASLPSGEKWALISRVPFEA